MNSKDWLFISRQGLFSVVFISETKSNPKLFEEAGGSVISVTCDEQLCSRS